MSRLFRSQKALSISLILGCGFAMFSMFFGSGNLVFPLKIGYEAEGYYNWATVGLIFTAVLIPFLGLYAVLLFNGSYEKFFSKLDKYSAFLTPLVILALIGPIGVIPRTITVAYGSFVTIFPATPLWLFSIIFCLITFFLIFKPQYIVPFLGFVLTPLLLLSLAAIVLSALVAQVPPVEVQPISALKSLGMGALTGYNTMDLMAAFFFAYIIINYVKEEVHTKVDCKKRQKRIELSSMLLAAGLLTIIYTAFVYLGSKYSDFLDASHAEQAIAVIANVSLGNYAGAVVTIAVILANLTTAIALAIVSAEFFQEKVVNKKVSLNVMLWIVLVISFVISNFEFSGIFAFLSPILIVLYPGLIVLTVLNVFARKLPKKFVIAAFYLTLLISLAYELSI